MRYSLIANVILAGMSNATVRPTQEMAYGTANGVVEAIKFPENINRCVEALRDYSDYVYTDDGARAVVELILEAALQPDPLP